MTDSARETEFTFSGADFERVRKLIYQRAGISLHAGKQAMVYSRLSRRLRDVGYSSFADYLQWLEQAKGPDGEREWQEFINCLTTNLTSFFREDHHFPVLAALHQMRKGRDARARRSSTRARKWWSSRKNEVRLVVRQLTNSCHSSCACGPEAPSSHCR